MPTKLELQAYYINQRIAQVICPFHYVSWDYHKLEWKYENIGFRRMWPYYSALVFTIFNILLFLTTIPFLHSGKCDLEQCRTHKYTIVAGLLVMVMCMYILVDYLFIVNGREWVYATNWMYRHEGIIRSKHNFHLPNRLNARHILDALGLILADLKGNPDWIGITFNYIAISYPFLGVICCVFYVIGEFDPMFVFVNEFNLAGLKLSYWFLLFRLFSFIIAGQWLLHNARACIFITVGMSVSFIRLLLNLKHAKIPTSDSLETSVNFFKELRVLLGLITCLTNTFIGNFLGLAYFLIVVGSCCLIFGVNQQDPQMITAFLFLTVVVFCGVLFVFKIGDFLHFTSTFLLKRWKNKCSKWQHFKSKVLLREIDSCRLLVIKAGDISVITATLQQGFFNALLQDSMTALLLLKNNFKTL